MTDHQMLQEMIAGKNSAPISLDPAKTALIVVDVQRYFTRSDSDFAKVFNTLMPGSMDGYYERVKTVISKVQRLQQCFRTQRLPVVFCAVGSIVGQGRDLPLWMREFDELSCQLLGRRNTPTKDEPDWQVDEAVAPLTGELVVNKMSSGALASTKLDQTLHNMGIDSVIVCGLTTAICVAQTARELADRDFRVVIASDACTERSPEMHDAALLSFCAVFGQSRSTDEIVDLISTAAENPLAAVAKA